MISPEERAQFARIKESYREWLQRARDESDERRAAGRRRHDGDAERFGESGGAREPMRGRAH